MSDRTERVCAECGSLLHHEDECPKRIGVEHLFFDEATGLILNSNGCCFAFHDYPEQPCEFRSFSDAEAYMKTVTGMERSWDLHTCNSTWEDA